MKCTVDHEFTEAEIARVVDYVLGARAAVVDHGPVSTEENPGSV